MRLRALRHDELEPPGDEIWDEVANGRRGKVDVSNGLPGPFNPLLYSPRIGRHVAALGEAVRFDGMLDDTLRELATLTVVVFWGAEFATRAHARLADQAGLSQPCIDALLCGNPPPVDDQPALVTSASPVRWSSRATSPTPPTETPLRCSASPGSSN